MRSKLKIYVYFLAFFCVLAVIASCLRFGFINIPGNPDSSNSGTPSASPRGACGRLCTSEHCVIEAANILSRMNQKIHPCDDLHDFACGDYPLDVSAATTHRTTSILSNSVVTMYMKLKQLLEATPTGTWQRKRQVVYESCLNSPGGRYEMVSLLNWVQNVVTPKWPYISSNTTGKDLKEWLVRFHLLGEFSFFTSQFEKRKVGEIERIVGKYGVNWPVQTDERLHIVIKPEISYLFMECTETERQSLLDFVSYHLQNMAFTEDDVVTVFKDVLDVDRKLKIFIDSLIRNRVSEFNCTGSQIGFEKWWCDIIVLILNETGSSVSLRNVEHDVQVYGKMRSIINFVKLQPKSAILNYLVVRLLVSNMRYLAQFNKHEKVPCSSDIESELHHPADPRYDCLFFLCHALPFSLTKDYVQKVYGRYKITLIDDVLTYVKSATYTYVRESPWMGDKLREVISEYISQTWIETVEYVDMIIHSDTETLLEDLHPYHNNFAINILESKQFKKYYQVKHFDKGLYHTFFMWKNPFIMEASAAETIAVAFGFFEMENFDPGQPKYLAFAIAGMVLGHEISHQIDIILTDLTETNSAEQVHAENLRDCLSKLYSQFTVPDIKLKISEGTNIFEDFPDILGAHLALKAFQNYLTDHGERIDLPGLRFSSEQMFVIAITQLWCEVGGSRSYRMYLNTNHSPARFRAMGPMMNNAAFPKLFNCSKDSYMNYRNRCEM